MTYIDCFLIVYEGSTSVLFDDYTQENTTAPEQKSRKSNISSTHIDVKMNLIIPTDQKKFLSCKEKQKLIDLFSFHLLQEGILVKHTLDNGDADTMIFQQALNKATKKNVVVHCINTKVFIALLHHFDIRGNSIVMKTKQELCSIEKVVSALDDDLRQCLLISHVISGCDTVSGTFGMGKLKASQI